MDRKLYLSDMVVMPVLCTVVDRELYLSDMVVMPVLCTVVGCPQGYRQKDYFIATQGPLSHTVEDYWRMAWEWKCHSVVMLTELQEREQVGRIFNPRNSIETTHII